MAIEARVQVGVQDCKNGARGYHSVIIVSVDGHPRLDRLGGLDDAVIAPFFHLRPELAELGHDRPATPQSRKREK